MREKFQQNEFLDFSLYISPHIILFPNRWWMNDYVNVHTFSHYFDHVNCIDKNLNTHHILSITNLILTINLIRKNNIKTILICIL